MKNKSQKRPYKPTLVEYEMIEITDPDEIAALERRIQEAEKMLAAREAPKKAKSRKRR